MTCPGGVINIISGRRAELVPWLAGHMDVNAIDTWGVPAGLGSASSRPRSRTSSGSLGRRARSDGFDWLDDARAQRPEWIAAFLEMKTVWHPVGM